ncbi:MAG TPA: PEP-CTERM sorting domain-containing protein [Bryobacteraceae bacterium]|nr:PEP-CTERM sorting domain-containing protein [Bryobacteraceae bacterium]
MFYRTLAASGLFLAACAIASAGEIAYSVNGGAWNFFAPAGGVAPNPFNTINVAGNTNCGIGASCNESSAFFANGVGGTGVDISGVINFTTTDAGGLTTQALENVTMTVDNATAGSPSVNVIVAFVSDEFDPSAAGSAGVGISGVFTNDDGITPVTADAQGEMDYYANGGVWNGAPGAGSFSLVTPLVGVAGAAPTPFWTATAIPGPITGIQELVGYVGVDVAGDSVVSFPMDFEDDDISALAEDAPEPGSYLLFGAGLVALGIFRRKRAAAH